MKTLLIDDLRDIKADVIARNFEAGIHALKNNMYGRFKTLFLDHDLGHADSDRLEVDGILYPMNGYGIMCFLENNDQFLPEEIIIVSSNPVGRQNIQRVIDKLYGEKI